jgi:hypothetical protein
MSGREIRNARIRSTMLGREDHGIPTAFVHLEWEGAGQGFGGYDLRHHTGFVQNVLDTVGVSAWEKLPGTVVRVDSDDCKAYRIGHAIDDRWYEPERKAK